MGVSETDPSLGNQLYLFKYQCIIIVITVFFNRSKSGLQFRLYYEVFVKIQ